MHISTVCTHTRMHTNKTHAHIVTDQQLASKSVSLLAPPQLAGEQHAYIPYNIAKETIAKVSNVCKLLTTVFLYIQLTHKAIVPNSIVTVCV